MTPPPGPLAPTAYDVLCARHAAAGMRLLRLALPVEDSAGRDLGVLLERAQSELRPAHDAGEVTDASFRPALLAAVRRQYDPHPEQLTAATAWAALRPASQAALWLGDVERWSDPEAVAELDSDAIASPAEAHDELSAALIDAHADDARREVCRQTRSDLVGYLSADLSQAETTRVSAHLECCRRCTALYLELSQGRTGAAGLLAPVVLGAAAAAYLASLPEPVRATPRERAGVFLASGPGRALLGTAAAAALVGLVSLAGAGLLGGGDGTPGEAPVAAPRPAVTAPAVTGTRAARPSGAPSADGSGSATGADGGAAGTADQAATTGTAATPGTEATPGSSGSSRPSSSPSADPTSAPPTPRPTRTPTRLPTPTLSPLPSLSPVPTLDPSAVDMRVSAKKSALGPVATVTVDYAGLAADQSGTVTLTSNALGATVSLDPRCTLVGIGTATCDVSGSGALQVVTADLSLTGSTLTVTAEPGRGLWDPAMDDNTASVVLSGRV